jgi:hypothetical protein
MKYLKLFSSNETEKKFSVSFDENYYGYVVSGLKKHNIKWEDVDSLYLHLKKKREIVAWSKSEFEVIRAIPAFVKHLQVFKIK